MTDPVDAVLFDLDDTLCRYNRSADELLEIAFDRVGVDPFFEATEYISRLGEFSDAGDDIRDTRRAAFGTFSTEAGHDESVGHEIADIYTDERDQSNVAFTEGAERALEAIGDSYRVGMVTNGDPWMQSQKLEGLDVADRFEVVVHGGYDAPYKPDPEPFHLALEEMGVPAERAVYVGNSLAADVRGALAAGLRSAWLSNGEAPEPEPDYVLDSLLDLVPPPWE